MGVEPAANEGVGASNNNSSKNGEDGLFMHRFLMGGGVVVST